MPLIFRKRMAVFMQVLILENAPSQLRGRLTLWLFEIKAGVYVSDVNSKLRMWIWEIVKENIGTGSAIMVWSTTKKAFGFDMAICGCTKRKLEEIDGISVMKIISD